MRRIKKLTAVLLVAVMMCTLYSGSMTPVLAKAEPAAEQEEAEAGETQTEVESPEAEEPDNEEGKTEEKEEEKKPEAAAEQPKAAEEKKEESRTEEAQDQPKAAESKQESGTEEATVKLTDISVKEDVDLNNISAPETLTIQLDLDAPEGCFVQSAQIIFYCEATGEYMPWDTGFLENQVNPSDGPLEVEIDLGSYAVQSKYTLDTIYFHADKDYYYYNYYEGTLDCTNDVTGITDSFPYNGEADFTVTSSEEDLFLPEVTDIRMWSEDPVTTGEDILFDVYYSEEGSGVKAVDFTYYEIDGDSEITVSDSGYGVEHWTGDGVIEVSAYGDDLIPGEYKLGSINITDYAGNSRSYQLLDGVDGLISSDNDELVIRPQASTLSVQGIESNGLKVKDLKIEGADDKDNLAAGDTFDVVMTIYNDISKDVPVRPKWCFVSWRETFDGAQDSYTAYAEGDEFVLKAGAEAELRFSVEISVYSGTQDFSLEQIALNAEKNSGFNPCTWYNAEYVEGDQYNLIGEGTSANNPQAGGVIDVLPYHGEIDWSVTTPTSTPDTEAPIIESVRVNPSTTAAPEKIELEIKTKGEEVSPVDSLSWSFLDKNRANNIFSGGSITPEELTGREVYSGEVTDILDGYYYSPLSYSEERGCYVAEIELDEMIVKGTYFLLEINLIDEAGNSNYYGYNGENGKLEAYLKDDSISVIDTCEFTVSESASPDEDFDAPIFEDLSLQVNQAEAGEVIQCRIKVNDATGISRLRLDYECDQDGDGEADTYLSLESRNVILQGDEYICDFVVDPYCTAGDYDLFSILIVDGSIRENYSTYLYDKLGNIILGPYGDDYVEMPAGRSFALAVTQPKGNMVVTDLMNGDNVLDATENVDEGGTVVVKGSYLEDLSEYRIPTEFFQAVKEKELTVIIPDAQGDSEIVVKGEDLSAIPDMDLELRIKREALVEDEAGVEKDDLYYPVDIVTSDASMPVTIRVKVDDEFLDQCGENPVRISRVGEDGTPTIVAENVSVNEDGYVEIKFPNGLQGTGVASQILYANAGGQRTIQEKYSFRISSQVDESEVMLGDVNGDGEIDIFDLTQCMNHIVEKAQLTGDKYKAADVNENGEVDIFDLTRIMNYIVEKTDTV